MTKKSNTHRPWVAGPCSDMHGVPSQRGVALLKALCIVAVLTAVGVLIVGRAVAIYSVYSKKASPECVNADIAVEQHRVKAAYQTDAKTIRLIAERERACGEEPDQQATTQAS